MSFGLGGFGLRVQELGLRNAEFMSSCGILARSHKGYVAGCRKS